MDKVGASGVITIEESKTAETGLEVVEGMQFDRGYISPYMVTDTDKMEAVIDDPYILITDKKISSIQEILPLLEQIVKTGKSSSSSQRTSRATRWPPCWSTVCAATSPACASRLPVSATAARNAQGYRHPDGRHVYLLRTQHEPA